MILIIRSLLAISSVFGEAPIANPSQKWKTELIQFACQSGNVSVVEEAMKEYGACDVLYARTSNVSYVGPAPVVETIKKIVGKNCYPTCLHMAALYGRKELVQFLLNEGVDARATVVGGFNALSMALLPHCTAFFANDSTPVYDDDADFEGTVNLLLDHCPDVNALDSLGATPLLYAACTGKPEVIRELLKSGADYAGIRNAGKEMVAIVLRLLQGREPAGMVTELAKWGMAAPITAGSIQSMLPFLTEDLKSHSADELNEIIQGVYMKDSIQLEYRLGNEIFDQLHSGLDCVEQPCFFCPKLYEAYNCSLQRKQALKYCKLPSKERGEVRARYCYKYGHCEEERHSGYIEEDCVCRWPFDGRNCGEWSWVFWLVIGLAIGGGVVILLVCAQLSQQKLGCLGFLWRPAVKFVVYGEAGKASIIRIRCGEDWRERFRQNGEGMDALLENPIRRLRGFSSSINCASCCYILLGFELTRRVVRHIYVEARTSDGTYWTFEKDKHLIVVQVAPSGNEARNADGSLPMVTSKKLGEYRNNLQLLDNVEDENPCFCTVSDIIDWIFSDQIEKRYHVIGSNCLFFADDLFTKFSKIQFPTNPSRISHSSSNDDAEERTPLFVQI